MKIIKAKVAAVLGPHEAAINAGSVSGVAVGDIARVVKRTHIVDPDTKAALGEVRTILVNLRVTSVTETFCVASTYEPIATDRGLLGLLSAQRVYEPYDPVQRITTSPSASDAGSIVISIGADVDIERPAPEKPSSPKEPTP